MKKTFFTLAASAFLLSTASNACDGRELPDDVTETGPSFQGAVAANMTQVATKKLQREGMKAGLAVAESFVPGAQLMAGAACFYSGTADDIEKGDGTLARDFGDTVKAAVELIPGGDYVTAACQYAKPPQCKTLTEGLSNVFLSGVSKTRTKHGRAAMAGDLARAAVETLPGGTLITAVTKAAGKQLHPDARSLTEGVFLGVGEIGGYIGGALGIDPGMDALSGGDYSDALSGGDYSDDESSDGDDQFLSCENSEE